MRIAQGNRSALVVGFSRQVDDAIRRVVASRRYQRGTDCPGNRVCIHQWALFAHLHIDEDLAPPIDFADHEFLHVGSALTLRFRHAGANSS
jgi:hypothetical protein